MVVTSRWKCSECGSICSRRPAWKVSPDSPRRTVEYTYKDMFDGREKTITQKLIDGICTTCKHLSSVHSFTFEKKNES